MSVLEWRKYRYKVVKAELDSSDELYQSVT